MTSGPDLATLQRARPSAASRGWAWLVFLPMRCWYLLDPQLGVAANEDSFSASEGSVSWFVGLNPERVPTMPWVWRLAGRGSSVTGELRIREQELRFVPIPYWRARGAGEVLGVIKWAVHDGRWSLYMLGDGAFLVRRSSGRRGGT